jgi:hypothetical protein
MSKYYRSCATDELPKKSGNSTVHYCFVFLKTFIKRISDRRRKGVLIEFFKKAFPPEQSQRATPMPF